MEFSQMMQNEASSKHRGAIYKKNTVEDQIESAPNDMGYKVLITLRFN